MSDIFTYFSSSFHPAPTSPVSSKLIPPRQDNLLFRSWSPVESLSVTRKHKILRAEREQERENRVTEYAGCAHEKGQEKIQKKERQWKTR